MTLSRNVILCHTFTPLVSLPFRSQIVVCVSVLMYWQWSPGLAPSRSPLHRQATELAQPSVRPVTSRLLCPTTYVLCWCPYDVCQIFPGLAGRYGSRFQTVTEATAGSTRRFEDQIVRQWSPGLAPDRPSLHRQATELAQPSVRPVTPKQLCSPLYHYTIYIVYVNI